MMLKEEKSLPPNLAVISGLLPYLPLETCRPVGGGIYMCGEKTQALIGSSIAENNTAFTENLKGTLKKKTFCTTFHSNKSTGILAKVLFFFSIWKGCTRL